MLLLSTPVHPAYINNPRPDQHRRDGGRNQSIRFGLQAQTMHYGDIAYRLLPSRFDYVSGQGSAGHHDQNRVQSSVPALPQRRGEEYSRYAMLLLLIDLVRANRSTC